MSAVANIREYASKDLWGMILEKKEGILSHSKF